MSQNKNPSPVYGMFDELTGLDLSHLTPEEKDAILRVAARAKEVEQVENKKLKKIQNQVAVFATELKTKSNDEKELKQSGRSTNETNRTKENLTSSIRKEINKSEHSNFPSSHKSENYIENGSVKKTAESTSKIKRQYDKVLASAATDLNASQHCHTCFKQLDVGQDVSAAARNKAVDAGATEKSIPINFYKCSGCALPTCDTCSAPSVLAKKGEHLCRLCLKQRELAARSNVWMKQPKPLYRSASESIVEKNLNSLQEQKSPSKDERGSRRSYSLSVTPTFQTDFPIKKNSERVVGKPKLEKVQQKFVLKNTKENLTETFQTENLSQDDEKFKAANGHFDNECNDNQRKIQNKKIPDKENSTKDKLNPDALEQRTFDMKNFSNKHKEKNVPIGISHTDFNQKPKLEPLEIIENQKKVKKNSLKNVEKELPVLTFEQKTNEENQEFQNNPSAFKKDVLSGIGVKEKARHYEEKSIKVKQELKDKRHENGLVNQPNKLTTKPQSFANGESQDPVENDATSGALKIFFEKTSNSSPGAGCAATSPAESASNTIVQTEDIKEPFSGIKENKFAATVSDKKQMKESTSNYKVLEKRDEKKTTRSRHPSFGSSLGESEGPAEWSVDEMDDGDTLFLVTSSETGHQSLPSEITAPGNLRSVSRDNKVITTSSSSAFSTQDTFQDAFEIVNEENDTEGDFTMFSYDPHEDDLGEDGKTFYDLKRTEPFDNLVSESKKVNEKVLNGQEANQLKSYQEKKPNSNSNEEVVFSFKSQNALIDKDITVADETVPDVKKSSNKRIEAAKLIPKRTELDIDRNIDFPNNQDQVDKFKAEKDFDLQASYKNEASKKSTDKILSKAKAISSSSKYPPIPARRTQKQNLTCDSKTNNKGPSTSMTTINDLKYSKNEKESFLNSNEKMKKIRDPRIGISSKSSYTNKYGTKILQTPSGARLPISPLAKSSNSSTNVVQEREVFRPKLPVPSQSSKKVIAVCNESYYDSDSESNRSESDEEDNFLLSATTTEPVHPEDMEESCFSQTKNGSSFFFRRTTSTDDFEQLLRQNTETPRLMRRRQKSNENNLSKMSAKKNENLKFNSSCSRSTSSLKFLQGDSNCDLMSKSSHMNELQVLSERRISSPYDSAVINHKTSNSLSSSFETHSTRMTHSNHKTNTTVTLSPDYLHKVENDFLGLPTIRSLARCMSCGTLSNFVGSNDSSVSLKSLPLNKPQLQLTESSEMKSKIGTISVDSSTQVTPDKENPPFNIASINLCQLTSLIQALKTSNEKSTDHFSDAISLGVPSKVPLINNFTQTQIPIVQEPLRSVSSGTVTSRDVGTNTCRNAELSQACKDKVIVNSENKSTETYPCLNCRDRFQQNKKDVAVGTECNDYQLSTQLLLNKGACLFNNFNQEERCKSKNCSAIENHCAISAPIQSYHEFQNSGLGCSLMNSCHANPTKVIDDDVKQQPCCHEDCVNYGENQTFFPKQTYNSSTFCSLPLRHSEPGFITKNFPTKQLLPFDQFSSQWNSLDSSKQKSINQIGTSNYCEFAENMSQIPNYLEKKERPFYDSENTENSAYRASTLRRSASVPIVDMLGPQRIEPLPPNSRDNLYRSSAGPGYGGLPYKDRKLHDRFIMFPKDSYQSSLGRIDFPPSSQMIMPYNRYTGSEYYTNQRLYIDDDMKRTYAPMNSPSALQPSTYSGFNSRYNSVRNYHTFSSTIPRSNKGLDHVETFSQFKASMDDLDQQHKELDMRLNYLELGKIKESSSNSFQKPGDRHSKQTTESNQSFYNKQTSDNASNQPQAPKHSYFEQKPIEKLNLPESKRNYVVVNDVRETFHPEARLRSEKRHDDPDRYFYKGNPDWSPQHKACNNPVTSSVGSKREKRSDQTWNKFLLPGTEKDPNRRSNRRSRELHSDAKSATYSPLHGNNNRCSFQRYDGSAKWPKQKRSRAAQNHLNHSNDATSSCFDCVDRSHHGVEHKRQNYIQHGSSCERSHDANYPPQPSEDLSSPWKKITREQSVSKPTIVINNEDRLPVIADNRKMTQHLKPNLRDFNQGSRHIDQKFKTSSQSYPQREQRNYCQKASVRARNSRHANNELVADEPFIDGCRMEARVSPCEITQANYEKNGHFLTPQDELRNVVSDTEEYNLRRKSDVDWFEKPQKHSRSHERSTYADFAEHRK